ncbi:hypothetical protein NDU88_001620 [Pleurodeles waltl]|uniref:Uncharacterized protein n=1 Tax=Pleurodeles waltl TaxID=8319 RepID=A0AAV7SZR4_PLEWA|nr:hypothetical protein NDU88_001620 [Pleurodeles waltl]
MVRAAVSALYACFTKVKLPAGTASLPLRFMFACGGSHPPAPSVELYYIASIRRLPPGPKPFWERNPKLHLGYWCHGGATGNEPGLTQLLRAHNAEGSSYTTVNGSTLPRATSASAAAQYGQTVVVSCRPGTKALRPGSYLFDLRSMVVSGRVKLDITVQKESDMVCRRFHGEPKPGCEGSEPRTSRGRLPEDLGEAGPSAWHGEADSLQRARDAPAAY